MLHISILSALHENKTSCPKQVIYFSPVSFYRMSLPCVRLCSRHVNSGLQVCGYATLSKASRPQEKSGGGPVFQYVGQHKKRTHKVFVWGFSFTGALGIPSFVVPDSGRKNPRKYQLTPHRLETAEQVASPVKIFPRISIVKDNGDTFDGCVPLLCHRSHPLLVVTASRSSHPRPKMRPNCGAWA